MSAFDLIHFIRPGWLAVLPLAVLLPWAWRRVRRPSGDWEKVCDEHLLRWLSVDQGGGGRPVAGALLAGLALLVAIVALAGPSWQQLPENTFSAREARVIAFDLSASMLAEDLRPNRVTRARFRVADLLLATREGQTGLVAFAGDAYVVSPLTNDANTIANLLPALQPDIMPVRGSRADRALELSATLLERAGFSHGEILLVTDSADARDAAKARALNDRGIVTSVLAVGTPDGAPIPSGNGFVSDSAGNVVIARLQAASMKDVAEAGGGRYTELVALPAGSAPWAASEGAEFTVRDEALDQRWKDAGPYLVLLLLPLALAGFRRGVLFVLVAGVLSGPMGVDNAHAGWWEDAWMRKDQQAWRALKAEEPERAAALARKPDLAGEAWYRSQEYQQALGQWSQLDSADAHYNRGNALAKLGEYDAAIEAYDRALTLEPGMEDASFNRDLIERLRDEQQEQQEQQGENGESQQGESMDAASEQSGEQQGEEQSTDGENAENAEGEQQAEQAGDAGEDGEQQQQFAEAWSEEDAQAMEQWLRRIPDDPGGLLRRKFIYEHQRRGAPADEAKPW